MVVSLAVVVSVDISDAVGMVVPMVVGLVVGLAARSRLALIWLMSSQPPIPMTSSPDAIGAIRLNASGEMTSRIAMTIAARTRMPRVWETVTLRPSATAWTAVPRVPTR